MPTREIAMYAGIRFRVSGVCKESYQRVAVSDQQTRIDRCALRDDFLDLTSES
jgi:hypothetical protein